MMSLVLFYISLALAVKDPKIVDLNNLKSLPELPVFFEGCEGECCGILKTKKVSENITLYETADVSSKKVAELKKGQIFKELTFFIKLTEFGFVREGEKDFKVLFYSGEGMSFIWDKDHLRDSQSDLEYHSPTTESWALIETTTGLKGWSKLPAKEFTYDSNEANKALTYGSCG